MKRFWIGFSVMYQRMCQDDLAYICTSLDLSCLQRWLWPQASSFLGGSWVYFISYEPFQQLGIKPWCGRKDQGGKL